MPHSNLSQTAGQNQLSKVMSRIRFRKPQSYSHQCGLVKSWGRACLVFQQAVPLLGDYKTSYLWTWEKKKYTLIQQELGKTFSVRVIHMASSRIALTWLLSSVRQFSSSGMALILLLQQQGCVDTKAVGLFAGCERELNRQLLLRLTSLSCHWTQLHAQSNPIPHWEP